MDYVSPNFPSKKALKEAVKAGENVQVISNSEFTANRNYSNGKFTVGGPHFPKNHTWYACVTVKDGKIVKIS